MIETRLNVADRRSLTASMARRTPLPDQELVVIRTLPTTERDQWASSTTPRIVRMARQDRPYRGSPLTPSLCSSTCSADLKIERPPRTQAARVLSQLTGGAARQRRLSQRPTPLRAADAALRSGATSREALEQEREGSPRTACIGALQVRPGNAIMARLPCPSLGRGRP